MKKQARKKETKKETKKRAPGGGRKPLFPEGCHVVFVRVSYPHYLALQSKAEESGMTVSDEVRKLLSKEFY